MALFSLAIFVVQQLGVVLGVGAETILLISYLIGLHKKESDFAHNNFVRAVRMTQGTGLTAIIVSGIGAVMFEAAIGSNGVLFAPAFIFKWILIGLVTGCYFTDRGVRTHPLVKWFAGGTWFALFLVHSLGPVTSWSNLLALYVLWLGVFGLIWGTFVMVMKRKARAEPAAVKTLSQPALVVVSAAVKPAAPPPPQKVVVPPAPPKPVMVIAPPPKPAPVPVVRVVAPPPPPIGGLPVLQPLELQNAPMPGVVPRPPAAVVAAPPPAPPPAPSVRTEDDELNYADLPALRVMPHSIEDLATHNRGPVVQMEATTA